MQAIVDKRSTNGVSTPVNISGALYPSNMASAAFQYCVPGPFGPMGKDDMNPYASLNMRGFGSTVGKHANGAGMPQLPMNGAQPHTPFYYTFGDRIFVASGAHNPYQQNGGGFGYQNGQYLAHGTFPAGHGLSNPSHGYMWTAGQQTASDVPELAPARRNSFSSNEENGPLTPFLGGTGADYQAKVVVPDSSHQSWDTPSPPQLGHTFFNHEAKTNGSSQLVLMDLDKICQQHPAIPRPIPAIFSGDKGRGTLESSLVNKYNTTNVYIRGLHPNTTDDMLYSYGARFGSIESAKSMLDQHTGACKGFGFIKYHNFADGQNCIRGFFHWGYESKWARVSHNEKLKKLGDANNTNLYISGIPTDISFNEHTLMAIFSDFKCLSSKILRDSNGLSRGVGFARFESPEECRQIIEHYNGRPVGSEANPISIRFADTADQKKLKQVTQERRQFKTHEYNVAAYGPNSPYQHYSTLAASFSSPLHNRSPTFASQYAGVGAHPYPFSSPLISHAHTSFRTPGSENVAPSGSAIHSIKIESPTEIHHKTENGVIHPLTQRFNSSNVQSPIKNVENAKNGVSRTSSHVNISPAKSSKSSPGKSLAAKVAMLKLT